MILRQSLPELLIFLFLLFLSAVVTASPLSTSHRCQSGDNLVIGAVGDFLMHDPFQKKAANRKSFLPLWEKWFDYTKTVDIMYGNLETPTAPGLNRRGVRVNDGSKLVYDNEVYTSYPLFNVHPQINADILESGFDIVSTANNHSLDRGALGIEMTIDELNRVGLTYVGTRKRSSESEGDYYRIIERNGITTAWIACTSVENIRDNNSIVLHCDREKPYVLKLIAALKARTDAVIITPHWGDEMSDVKPHQRGLAKEFLEAGATLVIGAHPHVLQPVEKYVTKDGRETLIAYSLGNFQGFHPNIRQKTTIMFFANLVRTKENQVVVQGFKFIPGFIRNRTGNLNDVEVIPVSAGGDLVQASLLPSESNQGLVRAAFNATRTMFGDFHMANFEDGLNFESLCY